ncbi:hypothetical protein MKW94_025701 [Papaver nudicaule]|uniref:Longin domain-containing protein n=1 Tax=Papaver nudicaule TaxID=74823 RepID=A0AA41VX69_PAPNU|nr:hypothetical protein [Papaver nudicaule]
MAILYSLVARGSVVLAEFSTASTNASAIARQILEKIPGNDDSHVSYSQDRYIFHVKRTDGLTVLCMADETAGIWFLCIYQSTVHTSVGIESYWNMLGLKQALMATTQPRTTTMVNKFSHFYCVSIRCDSTYSFSRRKTSLDISLWIGSFKHLLRVLVDCLSSRDSLYSNFRIGLEETPKVEIGTCL